MPKPRRSCGARSAAAPPRRRRHSGRGHAARFRPARRARQHHRPQRRDPGDLAADRRALRQSARNDRRRRHRAQAESRCCPTSTRTTVRARLQAEKQFVYLARQLTPRQELKINDLGIPGIYFEPTERRHYPLGRVAAQVLGGVDVDGHGVAGVEHFFDKRLRDDPTPLRAVARRARAGRGARRTRRRRWTEFNAIGACGIVMDVRTGEVLAMVSLPDYDANDVGRATPDERFNRAVDRHLRAGQHVQAADRVDGARQRHGAHLERVRRHASRSTSAASPSPISRASTAGSTCRRSSPIRPTSAPRTWPTRWAPSGSAPGCRTWACSAALGIELPEAGAAAGAAGVQLEGDRHHDDRLRPRHRGDAAARRRWHRGGRQRRHRAAARPSWRTTRRPAARGRAGDAAIDLRHHAQADARWW